MLVRRGDGRRDEIFLHLDCQVDQILRQLAVTERVGHPRVQLGDDQAAACTHRFDCGGKDVDLDPERDLALAPCRGVQQDHVGGTDRREQPRDEGQAHRQVIQPLAGVAHPGSDERRLEDHAIALGQGRLGGEHEQAVALHRGLQRIEQRPRRGEITAGHDPRLWGRQRRRDLLELLFRDDAHSSIPLRDRHHHPGGELHQPA